MTQSDVHALPQVMVSPRGHYESRFIRGNHPTLPLAFWIRHTVRIPRDRDDRATGEVWAIYFDGARRNVVAIRETWPLEQCTWGDRASVWKMGDSRLDVDSTEGGANQDQDAMRWALSWRPTAEMGARPVSLLPAFAYSGLMPTPKMLTQAPLVRFQGRLTINGETVDITDWAGSDNHNWGVRHSDDYVWAQVCGFDNFPDANFEGISSRQRLGRRWGPALTFINLRIDGEEFSIKGLLRAFKTDSEKTLTTWRFNATAPRGVRVSGTLEADAAMMAYLRYHSPCGAVQRCGNSKLARCELTLERPGKQTLILRSSHRAAFEVLEPAIE